MIKKYSLALLWALTSVVTAESLWAQQRYSTIRKDYAQFEESWQGDATVVFCHGNLHGTWLNGEPFEGIRFIDRMEVHGGLITRQDVWNDLAEHRKA